MLIKPIAPIVAFVRKAVLWDFCRALVKEHLPTVGTVASVWTAAVSMPCTFIGKKNSYLSCTNLVPYSRFSVKKNKKSEREIEIINLKLLPRHLSWLIFPFTGVP